VSPRQLPVVSGKRVVRALEKVGFEVVSTRGSHCKLRHMAPVNGIRKLIQIWHPKTDPPPAGFSPRPAGGGRGQGLGL
jgi:predicted RNA binding protein YcfA (HicA-like mRNA interferase family)